MIMLPKVEASLGFCILHKGTKQIFSSLILFRVYELQQIEFLCKVLGKLLSFSLQLCILLIMVCIVECEALPLRLHLRYEKPMQFS